MMLNTFDTNRLGLELVKSCRYDSHESLVTLLLDQYHVDPNFIMKSFLYEFGDDDDILVSPLFALSGVTEEYFDKIKDILVEHGADPLLRMRDGCLFLRRTSKVWVNRHLENMLVESFTP